MDRRLIVNADDCNLTAGVTEAILDCHERGVVTSTTFLINLPEEERLLKKLKGQSGLGIGLHLNLTLGRAVSAPQKIPSLADERGIFDRKQVLRRAVRSEILLEFENQIRLFRKKFGRLPTHLDTHHQVHDHFLFFSALQETARKHNLPVRRSACEAEARTVTPDALYRDKTPDGFWNEENLAEVLDSLPPGVSEIMCHPGRHDTELEAVSSFTSGREAEWRLFASGDLRRRMEAAGIRLTHFGLCYT